MLGLLVGTGVILGIAVLSLARAGQSGDPKELPLKAAAGADATAAAPSVVPVEVIRVELGTMQDMAEFNGTIQAKASASVVSEVGGKAAVVAADVGDHVGQGQLLCQLDTDIPAAQARQAKAGLLAAKAQLGRAKHAPALQRASSDVQVQQARSALTATQARLRQAESAGRIKPDEVATRIAQAQAGLDAAEANLREVRRGAREQERKRVRSAVEQAEAAYKLAENNYNIRMTLYTQGAISGTQYGEALAYYQTSKAQLDQARQQLSLVEEGATDNQVRMAETQVEQAREQLRLAKSLREQVDISQEDINAARTQVKQAEEGLQMALVNQEHQVPISEEDVRAARAGVAQAQAGLDLATTQLHKAGIYSPLTGVIASRMIQPGETVGTRDPIFRVLDLATVYLLAQVSELGVSRLAGGQPAEVTVDGLAGQTWPGKIGDVYPTTVDGQRRYIARIVVANPAERIRDGMFGRARVVFSQREAPRVDRDAIVRRDGESFAFRVVNDTLQRVVVKVGAEQDGRLEIVSGLQPNDIVVATGHAELQDQQKVKPEFVQRKPAKS
jgi:multidrug efflux pump subunit AcrA (membrane-fusion protein)